MSRYKTRKKIHPGALIMVLADIAAFIVSMMLASRYALGMPLRIFFIGHSDFCILMVFVTIVNFYFFDLYYSLKDYRRFRQAINFTLALIFSVLLISAFSFWDKSLLVPRRFALATFTLFFVLGIAVRLLFFLFKKPLVTKRAVIVGAGKCAKALVSRLEELEEQGRDTGIDIIGYVAEKPEDKDLFPGVRYLGFPEAINDIVDTTDADLMVYSTLSEKTGRVKETIIREKLRGVDLISSVALYSAISGQMPYDCIGDSWLIEDCLRGNKFSQTKIKRAADIIISFFFSLAFLPVIGILAVMIKLDSKGPVFFLQERVGRFGKPFKMIKLRSMTTECYREETPEGWHEKNKCRITRVGAFLRKTHLDELPQFFNVLKGDMSIVGPRPEMEMFITQCEDTIPFYRLRLAVRPGLTGWAQVWFSHTSTLEGYKTKFKYDLFYLANLSLKLDLEIMIRTILRVLGYPREQKFTEGK
ncbi:MAG: exopolysaccharide biosynthesis polyprenyl glycosylphosphotransferase [Candidatus Omnitrophica bacterium]|nr:exopolysaccharide biosynthesis polyprenyl glycosylphosphotransferase [Candidatus Omnitrophota bacterium]